jgi:putative hydrolase of the HAD superfamily
MDGTVLDLAFDNYFWRELVPQRYGAAKGISAEAAWLELEPHFRSLQGRLEWYCMDHWSELTKLNLAALTAEIRDRVRPLDGSEDFLKAVKASGRQLWLVTNAHCDSWMVKLEQTGLGVHFEHVVCSHDFSAPKESPDFWTRFMARHPFDPQRALFVDDSLPVLRAARDYGIGQCVAIRHPDSTRPAREITEFPAVNRLGDLRATLPQ